jgi:hypothetical protein
MWLTRTFTFVLPARSSPTTTRPRKTDWRCAATGPTSARTAIKPTCTTGKERRITRWEHEHILEAVQRRLDEHPEKMHQRRETVEHPFGTTNPKKASSKPPDQNCYASTKRFYTTETQSRHLRSSYWQHIKECDQVGRHGTMPMGVNV